MYVPIEIGFFLYHFKKTLLILYYCVIVQEKLLIDSTVVCKCGKRILFLFPTDRFAFCVHIG